MKVLIDHCVPAKLLRHLSRHDYVPARAMGWDTLVNGQLIRQCEVGGFDVLLTLDRGFATQHNVADLKIAIVIISGPRTDMASLVLRISDIQSGIDMAAHGSVTTV